MPRKKSAAKKAREAAKKAELQGKPVETRPDVPKEDNQVTEKKQEDITTLSEEASSLSSSEEEDDYGELITEEVDEGIKNVIQAIRTEATEKLLDPSVKFFESPEEAVAKLKKSEKQRPIYLKDYHRMNLLSGNQVDDEMEFGTVDGKQSFASQQREEKAQILSEINNAISEVGKTDSDDEFLTKKERPAAIEEKTILPDPSVDDEKFLQEFLDKQAWIPKKGDKMVDLKQHSGLQEDDDEFDDAVEKFETAYNFRYEDPNAAEIVSYARTQATLRRSETNARRRKREAEKAEKQKDKQEKEKAIHKKKTKTVNQVTDALERIKEEYGAEINEQMAAKLTETLLKGDFDDKKWDEVVGELFDEEFYSHKDKPTWDEDDEIMGDFYKQKEANVGSSDDEEIEAEEPPTKKSKMEKKKEKREKKGEKKKILEIVEDAVEKNKLAIIEKAEEERGRSKTANLELKFRYREVSPESFGLTTREILAADDVDLNEFIGLKKFAPYRPKELRNKDKRKVTKSRRLREWRKKVFNSEEGLQESDSKVVD